MMKRLVDRKTFRRVERSVYLIISWHISHIRRW